ncbi:hypothetical protein ES332_A12G196300v1 [Gossypium tomentosum]|uniref:Uncharacterized protein n=1 Tax=Gossypium tomentosum TaxID=34277 RepID=A0A5D2MZ23_GOSTO|nr:hypothetical protein ES332_A12G196300v1 [Gossypium tomentosum]
MTKNNLKFGKKQNTLSPFCLSNDRAPSPPTVPPPFLAEFSAKQCGNERVSPSLNDATPTTEEGSPATKPRAIPVSDVWKADGWCPKRWWWRA